MTDLKDTNPKEAFGDAKVPVGLVPDTALIEMALGMLEGALKYGGHNYRVKGVKASTYNHAIDRHRKKWWNGQDRDPLTRVHELASVMCCCAILLDSEICGMLTDDRPPVAPIGPLLDDRMEIVAHLKELFKGHNPHQFTWEDSPQVQALNESMQAGLREALGAGPLEPEGFPGGYDAASDTGCADEGCPHYGYPHGHSVAAAPLVEVPELPLAQPTHVHSPQPLMLDCGCVKRCKGHPVSLDAAKVDVPASPGNYAAERAAEAKGAEVPLNSMWQHGATPTGPKDPQGRPYASTTADAEFPHPPPVHRPVEAAREFDPAD